MNSRVTTDQQQVTTNVTSARKCLNLRHGIHKATSAKNKLLAIINHHHSL